MVVNRSRDIDYHTQINNRSVPFSSCNTTSYIMALKQAGWPIPEPREGEYVQPEDRLSAFLQTEEAREKQKEIAPWSVNGYPPQQVHSVLVWGVNEWIGAPAARFKERARPVDLLVAIDSGGGIVLSGNFPLPGTELGHIVSLAGYVAHDKTQEITDWIIDDPYGDWHTCYRSDKGNDIKLSGSQFNRVFDRKRNKRYWAHIVEHYRG